MVVSVCLYEFWMYQHVKYDFTANLTGISDRSLCEISFDYGSYFHRVVTRMIWILMCFDT